jgi:hypothetical protein
MSVWPNNHEWVRIGDDANIMELQMPNVPNRYTVLKNLLNGEFSGAAAGHIRDEVVRIEREVIVFESGEDCLAFLLKYGHIYGKHK